MLGKKSDTLKKNASSTRNSDTELNKSTNTLVKGPKPLQKLKFYLDVKNHAISSKLEGKIKDLGGVVEFFLDRGVTHVISDRSECTENSFGSVNSPATPRLRSIEFQYANDSPISPCESPVAGRLRQKTRADAMLEKVQSNSAAKVRDPLQNAKLWGIPVWTVNKVFSWLERVSANITISASKSKKVKVVNISPPFIKFEPFARNARPVYKSVKTWPMIDLESNTGKSAFYIKSEIPKSQVQNKNNLTEANSKSQIYKDTRNDQTGHLDSTNESRMTRKQRTRLSVRGGKEQDEKTNIVGGYCEICNCEYREIGEHVRSEQHLNFVKNDANFLELDSLISAGANVEAFLRLNGNSGKDLSSNYPLFGRRSLRNLNGKSSPEKCNGGLDPGYSPPLTRNRMPRTRSSNQSQRTPPPTHYLRSRGPTWNSSKDDEQPLKEKLEDEIPAEGRPKKTCPKTKRISADERLVADNKTYYKVEVMTTKLRSSGLGSREVEAVRRTQTPISEESEPEEQSLVVKFKKIRRSELSVLNDEAENFMFPRKDDPSFSDADTDDGPDTTKSPFKTDPSSDLRSSEPQFIEHEESSTEMSLEAETLKRKRKRTETSSEDTIETMSVDNFVNEIGLRRKPRKVYTEVDDQFDESSKDGSLLELETEIVKRKYKRRNVGEPSITDNQRPLNIVTSTPVVKTETVQKNNGECVEVKEKSEDEIRVEELKKELCPDDKFSFERLPTSEPWYNTFRRQDQGEEYYTCFSDPADYCARFLLPYQLEYLVPLDPKVCINEYLKKRAILFNTSENNPASLAGTSDTTVGEDSNSLGAVSSVSNSVDSSLASSTETRILGVGRRRKKRKSKFLKLNSSNPRKSPRQHASTLAILSSLIHQRKKRERKSHGESDTSRTSLGTITEENNINISTISEEELKIHEEKLRIQEEKLRIQEENAINLAKACEEILTTPMDDVSEPEFLDSFEGVEIKHCPDAIELVQNYDKDESPPLPKGFRRKILSPLGNSVRIIRRKRKKNRTGWPKKKKLFVKRCEKSEDGNGSLPELEDSRLTEISMEEEHGEFEMCELEPEGACVDKTEKRTNESVNNLEKCSEVQVRSEISKKEPSAVKEENLVENNTIQGVLQRTEQIKNDEICIKMEQSELDTEEINNELVESINNNSFSDLKIKEECTTDSTSIESEKNFSELSNGVVEECSNRVPYNVTILDCKKPLLKRNQRNSSSDCSAAEEVVPSKDNRLSSCVNVTLDKWENAEKVLTAKVQDNESGKLKQFQPFVKVQKIENNSGALQNANRRLRSSMTPERKPKPKRARIVPPSSPRSPRKLRTPRGKWYRER